MKKKCTKCKNLSQIVLCSGCQQLFCHEHIVEHRTEVSSKINNVSKNYGDFEEDLLKDDNVQTYLSRIDQWENESISKIKQAAQTARNELSKMNDRMKNELKSKCDIFKAELQSCQPTETSVEKNLDTWIKQLDRLRQIYSKTFTDNIIDESKSSIPLIKITEKVQSFSMEKTNVKGQETFDKINGFIELSSDRLIATCSGPKWDGSNVSGMNLYSSGIHSIRFRIKKTGVMNPFFGIISSARELNPWNHKIPFAYGWWNFPLKNDKPSTSENSTIQTGDEVTLTLDCTTSQIQFEHHRRKQILYESVAHEQCPFPWKIAIVLYSPGDSVSILS